MSAVESELRLARRRDARTIANLSRDLIETGLGWSWTPKRVERAISDSENLGLVAETRIEIVGFGLMEFHTNHAHLTLFAVREAHQRRGLGTRMLEWMTESARTAGCDRIVLEVRSTNEGAQRFYERAGYVAEKTLPGYYDGKEAAVRMVNDLIDPAVAEQKP